MTILQTYLIILAVSLVLIPFLSIKWKGIAALAAVVILAGLSGIVAFRALLGEPLEIMLAGTLVTGAVPVRVDALSGWFILLINFTFVTGGIYGFHYMKAYRSQVASLSLHCVAFLLVQSMLTIICAVQHSLVFLFAWEIMALAAFVLVIFEHEKKDVIKAGVNYLIQSHLSIVFLTVGFLWVASRMNSFDFQAIAGFSATHPEFVSLALFLCFFVGFAFKAGFVPFHTWLPYAHPAAPSHISGVMSGVIIKIGIYGILRMLLLVKTDHAVLGYFLLTISVLSGVYGVMLAILQHNLKKLLAYHSIENIGIIGIGIGLGALGMGTKNPALTTLGFAGALLHVLNHSLFKSLLFYAAGNVYQATHTMNVERLGGLVKRMPHTSLLFLVAALAICGLPPFNGFVSEFLIYSGLFRELGSPQLGSPLTLLTTVFGLVVIGGLALLCFTKAFGIVFLGTPRQEMEVKSKKAKGKSEDQALELSPVEGEKGKLLPMYLVMALMTAIGLFPAFFFRLLGEPLRLFFPAGLSAGLPGTTPVEALAVPAQILASIGWCAAGLMALAAAVFFIRQQVTARKPKAAGATWGCGYVGDARKMQYTASSFIRSYRKLAEPALAVFRKKKEITGIFPTEGWHETHPYDKLETWLVDAPQQWTKRFFDRFRFLQNGSPQFYVLYGLVFILLVIGLPLVVEMVRRLVEVLREI